MQPVDLCPQSPVVERPGYCLVDILPQCIKSNKTFQIMPSLCNVRCNVDVGIACLQVVAYISGTNLATSLFNDHFQFESDCSDNCCSAPAQQLYNSCIHQEARQVLVVHVYSNDAT